MTGPCGKEICDCRSSGIQAVPVSSAASDFKCAPVFSEIENELKKNGAQLVKKVNGVFCFKVKGADGKQGGWVVDVKNGNGAVKFDPAGKGDVTLTIADDDLLKLMLGKLNPQQAFFQGKLKIAGNMGLAMKLKDLQPKSGQAKL